MVKGTRERSMEGADLSNEEKRAGARTGRSSEEGFGGSGVAVARMTCDMR